MSELRDAINSDHFVSVDDDNNVMSASLVFLNGQLGPNFRRRRTDLVPAMPREREMTSSTSRINNSSSRSGISEVTPLPVSTAAPKRAVSMTRLDQLAKPRRRYLEESLKAFNSGNANTFGDDNSKAKSMSNLTNNKLNASRQTTIRQSMTHLSNERAKISANSLHKSVNNSIAALANTNKQMSKSVGHLSAKLPPRQTRTQKWRNESSLRSANSAVNVNYSNSGGNLVSPTRPVSSLLGSSEISKEGVKMRAKPSVPRKPRPVSIASFSTERKTDNKEGEVSARGSRSTERKSHESVPKVSPQTQPTPPLRSSRARSAGASPRQLSLASPDVESKNIANSTPKPPPPRKPAHVKAAAMARKTGKQSETAAIDHKSESEPQKANNNNDNDVNNDNVKAESVPSVDQNESEIVSTSESDSGLSSEEKKKKEEYKKMLAEKRKQAREMAEREAELEKERLEQQRLQELERQRKEEEEQKRLEEEQMKLLEEQKRAEEERLKRAIEEAKIKQEEENRRKEEELKARMEREEKEKKAREEVEKQRLELQERLKKDEEERLARKKKLEAIMSRTRKTPNAKESTSPSHSPNETPEPLISNSNGSSPQMSREEEKNMQNILMNEQKEEPLIITNQSKPDLVEDVSRARQNQINGSQNNNHIESPESSLDSANENLLDFRAVNVDSSVEQLINLNYSAPINSLPADSDGLSVNRMSNPFIASSGDMKSQEQTISDLLS